MVLKFGEKVRLLLICFMCFQWINVHANEPKKQIPAQNEMIVSDEQKVWDMLKNIIEDNARFVHEHSKDYFSTFFNTQTPRATVVGCSDSRFHTHALDETPDNDIFMIRNIGNQLGTCEGSIEYGVRHLKTPVLLFVGHDGCGAVTARTKGIDELEDTIKRELSGMEIPIHNVTAKDADIAINIEANIHAQVRLALNKFRDLIDAGKLRIIGALYDFRNEREDGYGKLVFLNINGDKDPQNIAAFMKTAAIKGHYVNESRPGLMDKARRFFKRLIPSVS